MKKILYIHHSLDWGGAPINIINIINNLDKKEYSATVFLMDECVLTQKLDENNIDYIISKSIFYKKFYKYFSHIDTSNLSRYDLLKYTKSCFSWVLSKFFFAKRELKNLNFDIYHINSSVLTDWLKPCSKKGKVVFHIQETITNKPKGFRYRFLRSQIDKYSDWIIAVSKHTAQKINLPKKTSVVYNFSELASKPNLKSYKSKQALYVGGEAKIKGFHTIVRSLEYLDPGIKVIFAGKYSERYKEIFFKKVSSRYRRKWQHLRIMRDSSNAEEVGLVSNIKYLLDRSAVLISPFTVPHFSRPIIEAYTNFKPVIATNIDGIDEIVNTGSQSTGIIVMRNNPVELAKAINYICSNFRFTHNMGMNSFEFAKEKFLPRNVDIIRNVYKQL